jgi:hypothetical protein
MRHCDGREFTAAEVAAWERSVAGVGPTTTDAEVAAAKLAKAKAAAIRAIEARTAALKDKGAEWPAGSGCYHALTDDRVAVYNGAQLRKGVLTYPREFIAKDKRIVTAANQQAHNEFDATLMARYLAVEDIGIQLIKEVHAATTIAELEAIVDDRT